MSAFDEQSLLKRILNRTRLFGSNPTGSTSPEEPPVVEPVIVEPTVAVTVINRVTDKPTAQSEEFRKAMHAAFMEQDSRAAAREAHAAKKAARLEEELRKEIPIVHGIKTMSHSLAEGGLVGMVPGSLRIGSYEDRFKSRKEEHEPHKDQEAKDREAAEMKEREAAEMKAKLASMSKTSSGLRGAGIEVKTYDIRNRFDTTPAPFKTIDDKIGSAISEELDRFSKDSDEDANAVEVIKRTLNRVKQIANYHEIDFYDLVEQLMSEEKVTPEIQALNGVAEAMTEYYTGEFSLDPTAFAMNTPKSLTVWKNAVEADGRTGYSKHSHIGGEEFIPIKAHVGKKGHIIVTFKPVQPEPYAWMEMPLTDCLNELAGFQQHFVRSELSVKWAEAQNAKQTAKKAADLEKFGAAYNDFGSY